jgi:hypothetical protein
MKIFLDLGTRWRSVVSFTPLPLYPPGERAPGTHWIGSWVDPSVGLDAVEKRKKFALPGIEPGPSSPSLYGLSYPNSGNYRDITKNRHVNSCLLKRASIGSNYTIAAYGIN